MFFDVELCVGCVDARADALICHACADVYGAECAVEICTTADFRPQLNGCCLSFRDFGSLHGMNVPKFEALNSI